MNSKPLFKYILMLLCTPVGQNSGLWKGNKRKEKRKEKKNATFLNASLFVLTEIKMLPKPKCQKPPWEAQG